MLGYFRARELIITIVHGETRRTIGGKESLFREARRANFGKYLFKSSARARRAGKKKVTQTLLFFLFFYFNSLTAPGEIIFQRSYVN